LIELRKCRKYLQAHNKCLQVPTCTYQATTACDTHLTTLEFRHTSSTDSYGERQNCIIAATAKGGKGTERRILSEERPIGSRTDIGPYPPAETRLFPATEPIIYTDLYPSCFDVEALAHGAMKHGALARRNTEQWKYALQYPADLHHHPHTEYSPISPRSLGSRTLRINEHVCQMITTRRGASRPLLRGAPAHTTNKKRPEPSIKGSHHPFHIELQLLSLAEPRLLPIDTPRLPSLTLTYTL
jgi:hypothetical protein